MGSARCRPRQASDTARAVRRLPVDRQITFAVGLIQQPQAVAGPDRKPVPTTERQFSWLRVTLQVVYDDIGIRFVGNDVGDSGTVGRKSRRLIDPTGRFSDSAVPCRSTVARLTCPLKRAPPRTPTHPYRRPNTGLRPS